MKRQLRVAFLVVGFACCLANASADDSFLKQELPTTWVIYRSNMELLQVLKSVVPKTFILPEGMSVPAGLPEPKPLTNPTEAEIKRARPNVIGCAGALFGRVPGDKKPYTVRDYLDHATMILGLTWNYDATQDAVVFDFPWHVSDPRSNAELMETLSKTVPPEDQKHVYSSTVDPRTDPWRLAFNALLSKPENFVNGWQMRWKGDAMAEDGLPPGSTQPENLFTGKILDETGKAHFLILNTRHGMMASTISFYLFSTTGKFEHGGFFGALDRHTMSAATAEIAADQKRVFIHSGTNPAYNRYDQVFAVEKDRFVFKDNLTNGKSTLPDNPFKYVFEVHAD